MKTSAKLFLRAAIFFMTFIFSVSLFANGFNVNSIGSRAASMGGAYIGLANDYSAVFWNPAGLTQLHGQAVGLYLTDVIPSYTLKWDDPDPSRPDTEADTKAHHYFSGLFSFYSRLKEKLIAGIAVYIPSDLGSEWDGNELINYPYPAEYAEREGRIRVIAISPVMAYKIDETLSIGGSLNIYYGTLNLKQIVLYKPYSESSSGLGIGLTAGFLFRPPGEIFSIGITFKTGYRIRFRGEAETSFLPVYPDVSPKSDFSRDITWPMCIGWGIAVRPSDKFIITSDFQWSNWSSIDIVDTDYEDQDWKRLLDVREKDIELMWDHTLQIRLGAEYQLNERLALRGGFYYDDSPTSGIRLNYLLPSITHLGITLGIGYRAGNLQYDFGLEYLIGLKEKIDFPQFYFGEHGGNIVMPNFSITYSF